MVTAAQPDLAEYCREAARHAKAAAAELALVRGEQKNAWLRQSAARLREQTAQLLQANADDIAAAPSFGLNEAAIDRLRLTPKRIEEIAIGLEEVAALPDPVGEVIESSVRPSGLEVLKVRVPLGVVFFIYESRPNVTADAAGLCLKAGNASILRGGSEAVRSNHAIVACVHEGLRAAGLPEAAVQAIATTDRAAVGYLIADDKHVDVIVPRGGKGLIERVQKESRIPVLAHLDGLCHTYVDGAADPAMARQIVLNAKMRRTGVCGATETLLIDRACAAAQLPGIADDLVKAGCALRGDSAARAIDTRIAAANDADWDTEYLDAILSIAVVDGVDAALAHSQACLPPVVLSEVLSDPKLPQRLEQALLQIPVLTLKAGYWERAGRLRALAIRGGHKAKLADTLIAQACLDRIAVYNPRYNAIILLNPEALADARAEYEKAIALDPSIGPAYLNLGMILIPFANGEGDAV
jgi:glutamate-5-semialdehyde dehydrogenase